MKKIVLAEIIGVILSIVFVSIFRLFVGDPPTVLAATFFAIASVVFVVIFAARIASVRLTDLSTSLFIFAGSILVAAVIILNVLTAVVIQTFPALTPFIALDIPITIIAFASAVFVLADAATITKKSVVAASLLIEAGLIVVGLTFAL